MNEHGDTSDATASWSAPALWRFSTARLSTPKRQRAAAVQNLADCDGAFLIHVAADESPLHLVGKVRAD